MSSQQYPRAGLAQGHGPGGNATVVQGKPANTGGHDDGGREGEHAPATATPLRDDKQETVVVRPYPQAHGVVSAVPAPLPQHLPVQPAVVAASAPPASAVPAPPHVPQGLPITFSEGPAKSALKTTMSGRVIAPAPVSAQGHLTLPHKVPSHITVPMENSIPQASGIPVATISGQQGHTANLHRIMATNVQIIRSGAPGLQLGSSTAPQHQFSTHLPRGAAAAAVMSSSKGATVLRPASSPNNGTGHPTVQHLIHQPIQTRPIVTTSTAVLPTVVPPVTGARPQSPVISTVTAHPGDIVHGRPALTIHPPPGNLSIQRPAPMRDTPTRITLPSHPAIGAQKPLPHSHAHLAQKPIFSTVTPVAAATVAPILATNTAPSPTTTGSIAANQISSNIVTVTMASHSAHATAVTTSNIPVAKVVPQPIAHTSPRIQSEFPGERGNLIPIPAHRSSPNPVTMENRSDNRQSVPVQFQYFLPTYHSAPYPLTHTYTPITTTEPTIRQYPVTAQAPAAAMPAQTSMGVASAVHLNSMQLMTVDRIAQINTQSIQPAAVAPQGVPPTAITAQGLHTSAPMTSQTIQAATASLQQTPAEAKTSVVLADGAALVANSISNAFSASQPAATVTQTHPQGGAGAPAVASSPRPSILRKKPASEGAAVRKNLITAQLADSSRMDIGLRNASGSPRPAGVKPKADVLMGLAPPVSSVQELAPGQSSEKQQQNPGPPPQIPAQPISSLLPSATPPSQPVPAAMAVTPPIPSMANVVAPPSHPATSSTAACAISSTLPEINVKQEVEPMDTSKPAVAAPPSGTPALAVPSADLAPGASPRKKPRKQQHVISTEGGEMMEANSSDEEKVLTKPPGHRPEKRKSPPKEYIDEEGVRYVPVRVRPPVTLLRHYRNPWKAAYHHFQRYTDVRVKEEKKGTLQDVASQKGVVGRAQGWKVHLCAAQLVQLTSLEHDVYSRLTSLQEGLIPKKKPGADDELHRISELIQGNMQRCKLVMDQITEAREAMMKVLEHRERVMKLLNKNGGAKKLHKLKRKDRA